MLQDAAQDLIDATHGLQQEYQALEKSSEPNEVLAIALVLVLVCSQSQCASVLRRFSVHFVARKLKLLISNFDAQSPGDVLCCLQQEYQALEKSSEPNEVLHAISTQALLCIP